jgi:predicted Rossmann fold flavoprotein
MSDIPKINFNLVIIGGGPAGMMAAISAKQHHPDMKVAIVDRTFELGRKLTISGSGRGNMTNTHLHDYLNGYFHGNTELLTAVFSQFGNAEIIHFFTQLGIPLYEEIKSNRGKIFPVIDHAKTVRDILVKEIESLGVAIRNNTEVLNMIQNDKGWIVHTAHEDFRSDFVILACGGKTYPALGSDGSGYMLAKSAGHTIIPPVPSAVPLVSKNPLSHYLQGEKLNLRVEAVIDNQAVAESVGEVLFTSYGLSGPAILDVSREISVRVNRERKNECTIKLVFFPDQTHEKISAEIRHRLKLHPTCKVAQCLWGLFSVKAAGAVCSVAKISPERTAGDASEFEITALIQVLTSFEIPISATRGWNEAEFTAGGVDTTEINPKTLASARANRLYFAGEIVDIDGSVGGFNLSWAWSSGWLAGQLIA